ncbi:25674_t:CDS:1, partial [Gigaspora rosea]
MFNQSSATPINENTDESSELNTDMDNTDVDEEQNIEPSNITSTDDWENQLRDWEQMLIDEETARLEEKEEERDNLYDYMEDDLLSDYKHPALDDRAKWELSSIF